MIGRMKDGKRPARLEPVEDGVRSASPQAMDDRAEFVILVDEADRDIGTAGKLDAHRRGLLHRALSVILRDADGRVLLQKRHARKYHSGGLWTNTCCSHPRPGETALLAAARRLDEEMGIAADLSPLMQVTYRAEVGNGLIEHELVHVFGGLYDGPVRPHPAEAEGFCWIAPAALEADLAARPGEYSVWFQKYCADHRDLILAPRETSRRVGRRS